MELDADCYLEKYLFAAKMSMGMSALEGDLALASRGLNLRLADGRPRPRTWQDLAVFGKAWQGIDRGLARLRPSLPLASFSLRCTRGYGKTQDVAQSSLTVSAA